MVLRGIAFAMLSMRRNCVASTHISLPPPCGEGLRVAVALNSQMKPHPNLSLPDLFRQSIVPIVGWRSDGIMDRRNESGDDKIGSAAAREPQGAVFQKYVCTRTHILRRIGLWKTLEEPVAFLQDLIDFVPWLDAPAGWPTES
jgi:hypothetical protein